jgi:hypothetical protein
MRIFSNVFLALFALILGCSSLDKNDEVRLEKFIHSWSPNVVLAPEPFGGHKEWMLSELVDSLDVAYLQWIGDWETEEHAGIDSLSNGPTMRAIKGELHGLIDCYFALYRLDLVFPKVACQLRPRFLRNPAAKGDSLLALADRLLGEIDSVGRDIALHGHAFNKLWTSFGEGDTLRFRHRIPARKWIVEEYVWFLAPELKRSLLRQH